jgi:glutaredoxin 3
MARVLMYATEVCPYCRRAEALLRRKGAELEKVRVDLAPERRAEMIERSGGRRTVPQIFIDERHIGGCDDLHALDRAGGLEALLAAAPPAA